MKEKTLKALALAEADRSGGATVRRKATRGSGGGGCLMVTQADAGASTVRFWRRQRLETGPQADSVVASCAGSGGKHGGTFVVYENTVSMLVTIDLESVYVRPKWRPKRQPVAGAGEAAATSAGAAEAPQVQTEAATAAQVDQEETAEGDEAAVPVVDPAASGGAAADDTRAAEPSPPADDNAVGDAVVEPVAAPEPVVSGGGADEELLPPPSSGTPPSTPPALQQGDTAAPEVESTSVEPAAEAETMQETAPQQEEAPASTAALICTEVLLPEACAHEAAAAAVAPAPAVPPLPQRPAAAAQTASDEAAEATQQEQPEAAPVPRPLAEALAPAQQRARELGLTLSCAKPGSPAAVIVPPMPAQVSCSIQPENGSQRPEQEASSGAAAAFGEEQGGIDWSAVDCDKLETEAVMSSGQAANMVAIEQSR